MILKQCWNVLILSQQSKLMWARVGVRLKVGYRGAFHLHRQGTHSPRLANHGIKLVIGGLVSSEVGVKID